MRRYFCQNILILELLLHLYSHLAGKLLPEFEALTILHHLAQVVGLFEVTVKVKVHFLCCLPQLRQQDLGELRVARVHDRPSVLHPGIALARVLHERKRGGALLVVIDGVAKNEPIIPVVEVVVVMIDEVGRVVRVLHKILHGIMLGVEGLH